MEFNLHLQLPWSHVSSWCKQNTTSCVIVVIERPSAAEITNCAFKSVCSQQCDELFKNTPLSDGTHLHHLLCSSWATAARRSRRSRRCSACSSASPAPDEDQQLKDVIRVIAGSSLCSHNPLSKQNVDNGRFCTHVLYFITVQTCFLNDYSNNFRRI